MATKALEKAFDAGQAAQKGGYPAEGCPFEEGSEEGDAWADGYTSPLAEKWQVLTGTAHEVEIEG
jgi:hypothetical protein